MLHHTRSIGLPISAVLLTLLTRRYTLTLDMNYTLSHWIESNWQARLEKPESGADRICLYFLLDSLYR